MLILGIDIGIKNLAFCLLEYDKNKENNPIKLFNDCKENWCKINILENKEICCACDNCQASVNKYCKVNSQTLYFCKTHNKAYYRKLLSLNPTEVLECDDGSKCEHCKSCKTKCKFSINNYKLCPKHKDVWIKKLEEERKLKEYKLKVKDFTGNEIKIKMLEKLEEYSNILLKADIVCIENQGKFTGGGGMKSYGEVIYTWFLLRGKVYDSNIKDIVYSSATLKLKLKNKDDINKKIEEAKNKYKQRKISSVEECEIICKEENEEWLEILNDYSKKDDMADAFLHAYCYIINRLN